MLKKAEQKFKQRCEQLARKISKEADIICTQIRYKEIIMDLNSNKRLKCSSVEYGFKNRIKVTFVGTGVGVQKFNATRRNTINRILKTNAVFEQDSKNPTHQMTITFTVNPNKM